MSLTQKIKAMARAKRLMDKIRELLTDEDIKNRDVAEENIARAAQLYDRLVALESKVNGVRHYREQAEMKLEETYQAMEWWFRDRNPHEREIAPEVGLWD